MKIFPYSTQCIDDCDIKAVVTALKGDFITQGSKVDEFEERIAKFVGVKFAISFNSATSALNVAYKIIKNDLSHSNSDSNSDSKLAKDFADSNSDFCIKDSTNVSDFYAKDSTNVSDSYAKDSAPIEFLTTPLTFCATANMMLENGIVPKFCDIDEMGNIDANNLPITPRTKAIVSVDYAGNSVGVEKIAKICKENNLYFISDSSHSFGGAFKNKKIGSFADMSIFSFHAVKPITTIEGGVITTNNEKFYKMAKLLRSHCIEKLELWDSEIISFSHDSSDFIGHNFRLSDVAAALGISQLEKIESFIEKRANIARIYDDEFKNIAKFRTLRIPPHIKSTYHLYPILLDSTLFPRKKEIFRALLENNIGIQVHYKPLYQFRLYNNHKPLKSANDFYNAEISIPCHQKLSHSDVDFIVSTIRKIFKKY